MDKSIDEIYEEMLSVFGEASGYLPSASCDLAARMYAAAAQIQGLYLQAQWLLDQSFPQTAKGEYLERHAQLRGLSRGIATCAAGVLRFGLSTAVGSDLTIKSGTVCMTAAGVRFATTDQAALKSGLLYVDVPAVALEPGKKGNVAAGSVTIMAAMPVGITACTNPAAFSGGDDAVWGAFTEKADVSNLTLKNLKINVTVLSGNVNLYLAFSGYAAGAKVSGVTFEQVEYEISASSNANVNNVQRGDGFTDENWLFGGFASDDEFISETGGISVKNVSLKLNGTAVAENISK